MSHNQIDHIVVTAPSLAAGAAFVEQRLGIVPQRGGEHLRMGTHNRLLRLGERLYLEVIAVNPEMPTPARSRWFDLDRLSPESLPRLSAWVARVRDIEQVASRCTESLGAIEPMSRGDLNWRITVPADGVVPLDGVAPALIEWEGERHPAAGLQDWGLALSKFEIFHPEPERIIRLLSAIGLQDSVSVTALTDGTAPRLLAHVQTAQGLRRL